MGKSQTMPELELVPRHVKAVVKYQTPAWTPPTLRGAMDSLVSLGGFTIHLPPPTPPPLTFHHPLYPTIHNPRPIILHQCPQITNNDAIEDGNVTKTWYREHNTFYNTAAERQHGMGGLLLDGDSLEASLDATSGRAGYRAFVNFGAFLSLKFDYLGPCRYCKVCLINVYNNSIDETNI